MELDIMIKAHNLEILAAERLRLMAFDKRLIIDCFANVVNILRVVIREKNGIMWEKFPSGGPPPQFGKPLLSKKKLGLFFILGPQEHFWSSPKNHHFG